MRAGEIGTEEFQRKQREFLDFYAESRGRRKGQRSGQIDYLSRHGEVVDALRAWRNLSPIPKGGRLVKNVFIDLGVAVGRDLVEVFEIKTSAARSDIYGALGQLMVHGTAAVSKKVIVLPHDESIASDLMFALHRLGIELLHFKLDEEKAVIV